MLYCKNIACSGALIVISSIKLDIVPTFNILQNRVHILNNFVTIILGVTIQSLIQALQFLKCTGLNAILLINEQDSYCECDFHERFQRQLVHRFPRICFLLMCNYYWSLYNTSDIFEYILQTIRKILIVTVYILVSEVSNIEIVVAPL